ncbi:MAG: Rid family hydrolase [Planctomycetota bacterium]
MTSEQERVHSASPWEREYGYCRAIRCKGWIVVGGTVALDERGEPFAPGDAGAQTARAFEMIESAMRELGASRTDIVLSRVFLTDMGQIDAVGRAHKAFMGEHVACLSVVGCPALIHEACVVEIEVEAVTPD